MLLDKVANACALSRWAAAYGSRGKPGTTKIILATQGARALPETSRPLQTEGAGKTGCALHPRSRVRIAQNKVHTSIQGSGEHLAFPAQWLYGLYRALPGDEFLVDSVAAGQLLTVRQLDACHGRQDHTVLPYARRRHRLAPTSVHRSPPNVRDDGRRPSELGRDE